MTSGGMLIGGSDDGVVGFRLPMSSDERGLGEQDGLQGSDEGELHRGGS